MPLPTFLMAGIQKAGTSSIYKYMEQHPEIGLGRAKEPNFLESELPPETIANNQAYYEKRAFRYSYEKYLNNFSQCTDELAIGDGSVNCLFHYETSIPRIQKYIPNAKIFVVLRHPVERAFSDYLMHLRDAIDSEQTLPLTRQSPSSFQLRKGLYYNPIKSFQETFGTQQFRVFFYKDLCENSVKMMKSIYEFIGVSTDFEPDTSQKDQTASIPKNSSINRLLRKPNPLKTVFRSTVGTLLPQEKRQAIRSWLISKNSKSKQSVSLSPEEREVLLDFYREDVLKLQDYLNRDLSAWLK
ncbi:sulfotransferase [Capilliphycus salinus ALCB114379]|uniref:sulfotransferase n=1 Tax=Capilliphycus salinus TaxID=2768948 RepID=UPI0039A66E55